jgi:hypothetical protein
MPLNIANSYTPSAAQTGRLQKPSEQLAAITFQLFTCTHHMSVHFVMQIRAGGRHVLSTHLTYHAHTITEMQQGKPAAHTHTHIQGMARDSYLSNRLFTYFATLQQLSTVNDTLKRAIHVGRPF